MKRHLIFLSGYRLTVCTIVVSYIDIGVVELFYKEKCAADVKLVPISSILDFKNSKHSNYNRKSLLEKSHPDPHLLQLFSSVNGFLTALVTSILLLLWNFFPPGFIILLFPLFAGSVFTKGFTSLSNMKKRDCQERRC